MKRLQQILASAWTSRLLCLLLFAAAWLHNETLWSVVLVLVGIVCASILWEAIPLMRRLWPTVADVAQISRHAGADRACPAQ